MKSEPVPRSKVPVPGDDVHDRPCREDLEQRANEAPALYPAYLPARRREAQSGEHGVGDREGEHHARHAPDAGEAVGETRVEHEDGDVQQGRGLGVLPRVEGPHEEEVHRVAEQSRRVDHEQPGDRQGICGIEVSALVEQPDDGLGERDHAHRRRYDDEDHRPQPEGERLAVTVGVPAGVILGELGHERGGDGDHEDAVGEREDSEGVVEFGEGLEPRGQVGAEELEAYGGGHQYDHRPCEPGRGEQSGVAKLRARPVSEAQHRRHQRQGHDREPRRDPYREHVEGQGLVGVDEQGVGDERGYDHQVVQHGGEGGQEEAPVGLQDARADGAYAVEEHLQAEDPEEQHREIQRPPGLGGGEPRLPVGDEQHQRPGEHDARDRKY